MLGRRDVEEGFVQRDRLDERSPLVDMTASDAST
jgi:hypothetical protein